MHRRAFASFMQWVCVLLICKKFGVKIQLAKIYATKIDLIKQELSQSITGQNIFDLTVPQLWQTLPSTIRNAEFLRQFKTKVTS